MLPSTLVLLPVEFAPAAYAGASVVLWGTSDFSGGMGARRANAFVVTAFSHLCAFGFMFAIAFVEHQALPSRASLMWALLAGSIGGFSLALFYRALASGQMGLTAPISALLGAAIPTLVDIFLEGAPSRWTILGFGLAIVAIWLITRPEASKDSSDSGRPAGVGMAALAGVGFAGFYLSIHQAAGSALWLATASRVGSLMTTVLAILILRAPLAMNRSSAGLGALAGILDISASALFIVANQRGRLDAAVVIASLYPAVTVLLARIVLKEHFSRWRFIGLLMALTSVPMIAAG